MRVSYNGITSAFQADDRGSIPLTRSFSATAEDGQAVEGGSTPPTRSTKFSI